jgi:hypothetical protein
MKETKIKCFCERHSHYLEREVNNFMANKEVVSVSYTTEKLGYEVHHYACVIYRE